LPVGEAAAWNAALPAEKLNFALEYGEQYQ